MNAIPPVTIPIASCTRRAVLRSLAAMSALACIPRVRANPARTVEAATKPGEPWRAFSTRTLEDLPQSRTAPTDSRLSTYGGLLGRRRAAAGFFRAEKIGPRWWLVDPEGALFINRGVVSVRPTHTAAGSAALGKKFGDGHAWAAQTAGMLRSNAFNGVGAWSDADALNAVQPRLVTTRLWSFMSSFGKQRGLTFVQPGHSGYKGDAIPVFDPAFETFADTYARQLAPMKDDPWLLGHFTDNELPLTRKALGNFLAAPCEHGQKAASDFLTARHGASAGVSDITDADAADFLALVVERYFRSVGAAVRKYDPHHLVLGSRFHAEKTHDTLACPEIFRACGPHVDVVSVNYYRAWTPDAAKLAMWERESKRPVLITEWYAKALDSGLANTGGAGWLVRTQAERGLFYQNFALALLESARMRGLALVQIQRQRPDRHRRRSIQSRQQQGHRERALRALRATARRHESAQ